MNLTAAVSQAITGMASVGTPSDLASLRREVSGKSLREWQDNILIKVAGCGVVTGIWGGPLGIAMEAADLAYLLRQCGRGCFGIGMIKGREVECSRDMPLILTIWADAGKAVKSAGHVVAGKLLFKVSGKAALAVTAGMATGALVPSLFANVILHKVSPIIASKITGKIAGKAGAKWIPLLGGAVSAGINYWIAKSLMEAATSYYTHDFVEITNPELSRALSERLAR